MLKKSTIFVAVLAAAALQFGGSANASPMSGVERTINVERPELQQIHYRPYRHCHWRYGRRVCHGGSAYRGYGGYGYGYRPGINLYIGGSGRGHHRGRRHHRR